MFALLLANLVLIVHMVFIFFVVFGGVLVLKWHKLAWLHIPCVVWGILIEFQGWFCPLTPLENYLLQSAGADIYEDSFIQHYLMPVIYPSGLTFNVQILLGFCVIIINFTIYCIVWHLWNNQKRG